MRVITTVAGMQKLSGSWKGRGVAVGLAPTMGCLHDGHLSLVKRARQEAGPSGIVVVSIYVNPTQFAPNEDFTKYPRDLDRDKSLCRKAGVDCLFVPSDTEMYPGRDSDHFSTYVVEEQLSARMEGESRPSHFRGVTTVVAKLFNIVQPSVAVFGAKDFQQAAIIQRMVSDLNFPVRIVVSSTVREPDGLALSSRNKYLSPQERKRALVLWRAIELARAAVRASMDPIPAGQLKQRVGSIIASKPSVVLDYVEFFSPVTLEPVSQVTRGTRMALAVFIGATRLIDNGSLE